MPVSSPAGPLKTLEDTVEELLERGAEALSREIVYPVLLVTAPLQVWSEMTQVSSASVPTRMLPTVVFPVVPGRLSRQLDRLTVGRSSVCDLVLPFGALSKVHGYLRVGPQGYAFEDAGSTNGTYLNSVRLVAGESVPLRDGETLRLGDVSAEISSPDRYLKLLRRRAGLSPANAL